MLTMVSEYETILHNICNNFSDVSSHASCMMICHYIWWYDTMMIWHDIRYDDDDIRYDDDDIRYDVIWWYKIWCYKIWWYFIWCCRIWWYVKLYDDMWNHKMIPHILPQNDKINILYRNICYLLVRFHFLKAKLEKSPSKLWPIMCDRQRTMAIDAPTFRSVGFLNDQ